MTAIAGYVKDGRIWLGGDRAGTTDCDLIHTTQPKVFHLRDSKLVIGYAGSYRLGQVVQYALVPPVCASKNDFEYLFRFCNTLRDLVKEYGAIESKDSFERVVDWGSLIVGYNSQLYTVHSNFTFTQSRLPYIADGCGAKTVNGAFHAMEMIHDIAPEVRVKWALEAAEMHNVHVKGPFDIIRTGE